MEEKTKINNTTIAIGTCTFKWTSSFDFNDTLCQQRMSVKMLTRDDVRVAIVNWPPNTNRRVGNTKSDIEI